MRTVTQKRAREINTLIRAAQTRSRNVYIKQQDGNAYQIYVASARGGSLRVRYLGTGDWTEVHSYHHIYEQ